MKKFFIFLFSFFLFSQCVYAEEFTNLNYLDWVLRSQNDTILNSGNTPFLTSYLGRDYPNSKLILDYTNYIFYPGYYYDVTFQYFFENKNDMGSQNFVEGVTDCYIYPWQSNSYTVDSCEIVSKTSTSFKVRATNLRTSSNSAIAIRLTNTYNFNALPTDIVYVQLNSYILNIVRKDNTGISEDTFEDGVNDIINNQNSNTNSINSNANTNSQNEINNATQNKNDIINNQNSNTDKQISSQKVCTIIDKNNISLFSQALLDDGSLTQNTTSWGVTDYIKINSTYELKPLSKEGSAPALCFYDSIKTLISCVRIGDFVIDSNLTIPANAAYFRASIVIGYNRPTFQLCSNGNQALTDKIDDSSVDSPSGVFDDLSSKLATNNVISSLITLPITFYTNVLNGLNGTCSSFNLGNLLGTDIILPCINISNYIGNTLFNIIDILFSGFFIFHMSKKFISVFDNMSSLKDGDVIDD